ncbi:hypothetical protein [uncultured Chryseobacterium sp.]|uniref:hypothetical protein n=1 Tax=uncultured Chryseobacterium sp. TaxID=259322 RepID=UPI0025F65234|nr:hypothetical protein [uncultured Chryseobacterium sp.]
MKKLILICVMVFSGIAYAQQSDNPFVYDEISEEKADPVPGTPADPVPIDGYVQILFLAGIAIIFLYANRKKSLDA